MPRVLAAYDGASAGAEAELNAGELPEAVPLHGEQQQQQQQPALSFFSDVSLQAGVSRKQEALHLKMIAIMERLQRRRSSPWRASTLSSSSIRWSTGRRTSSR